MATTSNAPSRRRARPPALLKRAAEEALRLLDADGALIYLLDPDSGTLRCAYDAGLEDRDRRHRVRRFNVRVGDGMFGVAVAERRVVVTGDYTADRSFTHLLEVDRFVAEVGIRSMVVAPLAIDDRVFGALGAFSARPESFGQAHVALVRSLADHAAAAMANERLIEELGRSRAELERRAEAERTLREIATRISSIRDPDAVIQQAVDEAARLLRAETARIDLIHPVTRLLRWAYQSGGERPGAEVWPVDPDETLDQGVAGRAVASNAVWVTGDYLADDRFVHGEGADEYVAAAGISSVMSAPLVGEGGPFGALTVCASRPHAWGVDDAALLEAIATHAAIALTNARLIEQLNQSREALARRAEAERALREITARITTIRDPAELLQHVVEEANRLVRADGTILDLLDEATNRLHWAYDSGVAARLAPEDVMDLSLPVGVGATGIAVAEDRVVTAGDDLVAQFPPSDVSDRFFERTGFRSLIAAPITTDGGPLGAIEVYSTRPFAFDDADAALIRSLADQAAVTIANARLIEQLERTREEVQRRADTERAVRQITASLSAVRDPAVVLQMTVDQALRLLRSDNARIDLLEGTTLRWVYTAGEAHGLPEHPDDPTEIGEGVAGTAVARGRPFRTGDYLVDTTFRHRPYPDRFVASIGVRSALSAPLIGESGPLGALSVSTREPHFYDDEHEELLQALADQAAIAIQNARLIEELEGSQRALGARVERERTLRDMAARIAELRDPDELLRRVVEESRRLLGSDGAHLTRLSEDGTYVRPVVVAGEIDESTEAWLKGQRFPLRAGINGLAAARNEPVWTEDYRNDPRIPREPDDIETAERLGLCGMAAVPLRAPEGEVVGTLAVSFREVHAFDPDDIALLQGLADHAAIGLANTHLYERLRESEARYRNLLQSSPDIIWAADGDGRYTFVSARIEELLGRRPADVVGHHFSEFIAPATLDAANAGYRQLLETPTSLQRLRFALLHADGREIPYEVTAVGTAGEDGRLAAVTGVARDVSERDRLERELRDSEARFRQLVQATPDVIWRTDADGRFTFIAEGAEPLFGYGVDDIIGQHFGFLTMAESMRDALENHRRMSQAPDLLYRVRYVLRRSDGSTFPAEISAISLFDDDGFVGLQGTVRDVSERERLEQALRDSEARYRFLLQNSPDIIFSTDADGVITYLSETIERLTGWQPEEMIGRHFSQLVERTSGNGSQSHWDAVAADPSLAQIVTLKMRLKNGSMAPFEISTIGMADNEGRFAGVHGSARDVSERESLERHLRQQAAELAASEERAHLARELHDSVTQALFSMTLLTRTIEMLVDRDPATARQKLADLRELQREALAEMRALIFELRPGNLENDGLVPALRTHAGALQGRIGLPIVVKSDLAERPPIEVEEVLYRIAQEALHNIVKHAAARQVGIELERGAGEVRLRIEDDGKGFDPEVVPEGHLGLAGMRARAERLGGHLEVRSTPGGGTSVVVAVPDRSAVDELPAEA